jgi:hypothetical protein
MDHSVDDRCLAKREKGAYSPYVNPGGTPPAGMDRCRERENDRVIHLQALAIHGAMHECIAPSGLMRRRQRSAVIPRGSKRCLRAIAVSQRGSSADHRSIIHRSIIDLSLIDYDGWTPTPKATADSMARSQA